MVSLELLVSKVRNLVAEDLTYAFATKLTIQALEGKQKAAQEVMFK